MKAAALFFLVISAWVVPFQALWAEPAAPAVRVSANAASASVPAAVSDKTQENPTGAEPEAEEATIARDPFLTWVPSKIEQIEQNLPGGMPGGAAPEEKPFDPEVYKVKGIVWGVEKARAIINGNIVGVGDKVLDAEILRIDKEGILLLFQEKEYLLARSTIDGKASKEENR